MEICVAVMGLACTKDRETMNLHTILAWNPIGKRPLGRSREEMKE